MVADQALVSRIHARLPQALQALIRRRWGRASVEAAFDVTAWMMALLAAGRMVNGGPPVEIGVATLGRLALTVTVGAIGCGLFAGLYRHRYQRGSLDEMVGVLGAVLGTSLCLALATRIPAPNAATPEPLVLAVGGVLATLVMLGGRYAVFALRLRARRPAPTATDIVVFGAGKAGEQLIRRLVTEPGAAYHPVAILDDDPAKRQLLVHGLPVLGGRGQMAEVAARSGAKVLVIALAAVDRTVIRELVDLAERHGLTPKVIPAMQELIRGHARIETVRDPRIADLLGRRPVRTDLAAITDHFAGQRILVTGAGGSIGSELCRQLHRIGPAMLILLDRDESALHALELDLHGHGLLTSDETVVADIRDPARVREIFLWFRPQIVFHAAALKHLPLLERHPGEAVMTNVWGTLAVLDAAVASGTRAFVNISTDKAAAPISVLGYTKRIAERLTSHMAAVSDAAYLSVRFGNVLGSKGSVLTSLSVQIASGGPVTVTHPDVTRYFMTADEAVQLVLQAAVIGRGGEVMVLDMGEPVRIADIARRLGAGDGSGIDIVFTGLRPGEKLAEDLLGPDEIDDRPVHPLISQVLVPPLRPTMVAGLDPHAPASPLRADLATLAGSPLTGPAVTTEHSALAALDQAAVL